MLTPGHAMPWHYGGSPALCVAAVAGWLIPVPMLYAMLPAFAEVFEDPDELPAFMAWAMDNRAAVLALCVIGAAILIAKELLLSNRPLKLTINVAALLISAGIIVGTFASFYMPMIESLQSI